MSYNVDISNCDREPIHIPGSIQSHGAMLVSSRDFSIVRTSANCGSFFGRAPGELLGQPLHSLLSDEDVGLIKTIWADQANLRSVDARCKILPQQESRVFDVHILKNEHQCILEFEPWTPPAFGLSLFHRKMQQGLSAILAASTVSALEQTLTREIKKITGFDRVMFYRFDANWNGSVIAEEREPYMASYFDLHFPASDIPAQARALYKLNRSRLISNVNDAQSPLLAENPDEEPLDLTYAYLRSVSPIHLQYLRNMQVQASLSISLVKEGELWGLIACHHNAPKFVPCHIRILCESLAEIACVHLSDLIRMDGQQRRLLAWQVVRHLIERMSGRTDDQADALTAGKPNLLSLVEASGAAMLRSDKFQCLGSAPDRQQTLDLVSWLEEQGLEEFHCDDLPARYGTAREFADVASGVLAVKISRTGHDWLLWFRPEVHKTVKWSGDPAKAVVAQANGQLNPRASFDLWTESVRGTSLPWSDSEIEAALHLRAALLDFAQAEAKLRELNTALEARVQEVSDARDAAVEANMVKSQFVANISHEIRTPMSGVLGLAEILLHQNLAPDTHRIAEHIFTSAKSLLTLVNDLLDLSRLEAMSLVLNPREFNVAELIGEISLIEEQSMKKKGLNFHIRIDPSVPEAAVADPNRLRQVILNLVHNAVKFTDKGSIDVGVSSSSLKSGQVALKFSVRDTGIGIPDSIKEKLFNPFVQADVSDTRRYGGTGLGLSIAKRLVLLMKGEIGFTSREGEGSTFWFIVPVGVA